MVQLGLLGGSLSFLWARLLAHPGVSLGPDPAIGVILICEFLTPPLIHLLMLGAPCTAGHCSTALSLVGMFCELEKKSGKGQFPLSSPLILHSQARINLGKALRGESNSNLKNLLIKAGFRNSIPLNVLAGSPALH